MNKSLAEEAEIQGSMEPKQVVREALQALTAGEYRGYIDRLAEDVRFHVVGNERRAGDLIGRETVWTTLLEPSSKSIGEAGFREEILKIFSQGEWVAVESKGYEITTDGRPYDNEYCVFYRVVRGEIAEVRIYFDSDLAMRVKTL